MGENQLYKNAQKLPPEMVYTKKVVFKSLQNERKGNHQWKTSVPESLF